MPYFHTVNVIVEHDNNEICLVKRGASCASMPNQFVLPGGRLEYGEDIFSGAIRELKEETDLVVQRDDLHFCYMNQRKKPDNSIVFDFYFYASKWQGAPRNTEPDKHDDVAFYDTEKAQSLIKDHRDAIANRHQKMVIGVGDLSHM